MGSPISVKCPVCEVDWRLHADEQECPERNEDPPRDETVKLFDETVKLFDETIQLLAEALTTDQVIVKESQLWTIRTPKKKSPST